MAHCQDRHMYTKTTKTKGPTAQCQFDTSLGLFISTVKNVKQTIGTVFRSENFRFSLFGDRLKSSASRNNFVFIKAVCLHATNVIYMGGFYITSGAPCVGCTFLVLLTCMQNPRV